MYICLWFCLYIHTHAPSLSRYKAKGAATVSRYAAQECCRATESFKTTGWSLDSDNSTTVCNRQFWPNRARCAVEGGCVFNTATTVLVFWDNVFRHIPQGIYCRSSHIHADKRIRTCVSTEYPMNDGRTTAIMRCSRRTLMCLVISIIYRCRPTALEYNRWYNHTVHTSAWLS